MSNYEFTKQHRARLSDAAHRRFSDPKEREKRSGANNPRYGVVVGEATRKKLSDSAYYRFLDPNEHDKVSYGTWKAMQDPKVRESMCGPNHPLYGKHMPSETCLKISNSLQGKRRTKEFCEHLSQIRTGQGNPMFAKPSPHSKGHKDSYLGHYVRSSWEYEVCYFLKESRILYAYEEDRFDLGVVTYCPDIKLSDHVYLEVKGWPWGKSIEIIKEFLHQNPNKVLIVIAGERALKELSKLGQFCNLAQLNYMLNWKPMLIKTLQERGVTSGNEQMEGCK
jgi:hypothetical protein